MEFFGIGTWIEDSFTISPSIIFITLYLVSLLFLQSVFALWFTTAAVYLATISTIWLI